MHSLLFSTGNTTKFTNAHEVCIQYGIALTQNALDIDEIQGEDPERIITDKAKKVFDIVKQPVIVSDDSWEIPGLKGFPGSYMKSINHWFTPETFIHLTKPLEDKRVFLHCRLAYTDGTVMKLFLNTQEGKLVDKPRGSAGPPSQKVISMNGDNGLTISEIYDNKLPHDRRAVHEQWDMFCKWYTELHNIS